LIRINQPEMDLSEFSLSSRAYKTQELFLYAPRDLYRPGEQVNINALLRDDDGQMVSATPIRVEIKRPDNRVFKTLNWQGDENSFYATQFNIPTDAMTGEWIFSAKLANNDVFQYPFAVEDFMPERLKLELTVGNDSLNIALNETPKIKVQSDYLYGAPAAKNRFDATVTVNAQNSLFDDYEDYSFGSNNYKEYDLNFTTVSKMLDDNGSGELTIEPNWKSAKFPLRVKSFVNVYESGGRPISRKIIQTIWPYDLAIGVRPLWDGDYASPNSNSDIELVAINQQGERITVNNAEILLIRENSQRYWHWGDDGWSYNQSERNLPVYSSIVNISDNSKTLLSLPLDYGNYRVEIRNESQTLISSYQFFSGWRWYNQNSASGERPDQIKLQWQADNLTPGSQAELQITAPYTGTALITVESDNLLWKQTIEMTASQQIINIPIDANWKRHDLHASVMVIQKGEIKRKHLPKRAFGVIHLPINRDNRKLDISIDAPEKILPDREVTIKVKANNLKNTETFVTLATVDTGVLNVSNFDTPKPHEWFFANRQYIAEIRDMYGSIIALVDGKNARQKFGGDADLARGGDEPSSDVQIISMISEKVQFDADGIANITVKMPYFNGEVRLMAMAFNDNQFVGADTRMKVAAPVVIETSLPRFIAKGDETFATIDVHNTQANEQVIDLQIIASDSLGAKILEQKITLAANEKKIFKLPITAELHSGTGQVDVIANMQRDDAFIVNRQWSVGMRPAFPAIIESTSDILDAGDTFKVSNKMFEKFDQANLKSVLKISNLPVLNAEEQLQHLIQYPYGCLEQTTSRAWPLMLIEKSDLGFFKSEKQEKIYSERAELIDGAISRLLGMQRYDGSFGLWKNDSNEEYWLTVYVTEFMLKAKSLGYNISKEALAKAVKRLQYYVKGRANLNSDLKRHLSDINYFKLSYQAYAAYVLADIKQVNLQDVRKLYDNSTSKIKSPLPLAYLALALEKMGDSRRAQQAWLKVVDLKWSKNRYSYYGDYGSKVRDLSQIVELGLQSNLTNDLPKSTFQLLKPLQEELRKRKWLSTQERGAIFRVAKALKNNKNSTDKWRATLSISEENQSYEQTNDLIRVWYEQDASRPITINNDGNIPLYVDFKTQGYLAKAVPESNGISVERRFFNLQGEKLDTSKLSTGEMVLVHIKINLDKKYSYLPDAMLIELLPAGLELENQNLEHSMKLDDIKIDGKKITDMIHTKIKHSEYRDDRYIAALTLSGYNDNHLFYLARAVTPGTYTVPPTLVEDMYRPEIRAIGESVGKMVISE
ncbi:MAG: alpha-2-macroglobulin family protein, partial [Proteobacteria bacterium]|nr:alpha-2-macroglobulin family protein [Pseudomonadota bacterium]